MSTIQQTLNYLIEQTHHQTQHYRWQQTFVVPEKRSWKWWLKYLSNIPLFGIQTGIFKYCTLQPILIIMIYIIQPAILLFWFSSAGYNLPIFGHMMIFILLLSFSLSEIYLLSHYFNHIFISINIAQKEISVFQKNQLKQTITLHPHNSLIFESNQVILNYEYGKSLILLQYINLIEIESIKEQFNATEQSQIRAWMDDLAHRCGITILSY